MSSDEDDVPDADSCGYGEIFSQFMKWSMIDEKKISEMCYGLHIAADKSFSKTVVGTSKGSANIYEIAPTGLTDLTNLNIECNGDDSISGVEFGKDNVNLLYVGSTQGFINVYDLRKNQKIQTFYERVNEIKIPISCFDINSNDRIMCAGSEKVCSDAFLLFFDTRQRKSLGAYYESHDDDITSIRFHPTHPDYLISGSTDGLVNIFDICKTNEDDALTAVINSENSVQKLNWHEKSSSKCVISCITHTNDFKLYDSEEGDLICEHSRGDISDFLRRKKSDFCNIVNSHSKSDGSIFLLAGSNYKDYILRSVFVNTNRLRPCGNYEGNKQIVRATVSNESANILITAGENSAVNLWREIAPVQNPVNFKVNDKKTSSIHNQKPY